MGSSPPSRARVLLLAHHHERAPCHEPYALSGSRGRRRGNASRVEGRKQIVEVRRIDEGIGRSEKAHEREHAHLCVSIYSPDRTPDDPLTVVESHPRAAVARRRTVDETGQGRGRAVDGDGRAAAVERVAGGRRIARGVRTTEWIQRAAAAVVGQAPGPEGPRMRSYGTRTSAQGHEKAPPARGPACVPCRPRSRQQWSRTSWLRAAMIRRRSWSLGRDRRMLGTRQGCRTRASAGSASSPIRLPHRRTQRRPPSWSSCSPCVSYGRPALAPYALRTDDRPCPAGWATAAGPTPGAAPALRSGRDGMLPSRSAASRKTAWVRRRAGRMRHTVWCPCRHRERRHLPCGGGRPQGPERDSSSHPLGGPPCSFYPPPRHRADRQDLSQARATTRFRPARFAS
jgi:hypothetical protein